MEQESGLGDSGKKSIRCKHPSTPYALKILEKHIFIAPHPRDLESVTDDVDQLFQVTSLGTRFSLQQLMYEPIQCLFHQLIQVLIPR